MNLAALVYDDRGSLVMASESAAAVLGDRAGSPSTRIDAAIGELRLQLRSRDMRSTMTIEIEDRGQRLAVQASRLDALTAGAVLVLISTAGRPTDGNPIDTIRLRTLRTLYPSVLHGFRAPLNTILTNIELLRAAQPETSRAELEALQQRFTDRIATEVLRLTNSIDQFFGRFQTTTSQAHSSDLQSVLDDLESLIAGQARAANLRFTRSRYSGPTRVSAPPDRLADIVLDVTVALLAELPAGCELVLAIERSADGLSLCLGEPQPSTTPTSNDASPPADFVDKDLATLGLALASFGGALRNTRTATGRRRVELRLPLAPADSDMS